MSKVIIYTTAYNAEKTLRRAVESVLVQTHIDFVYYLLDNASTDNTHEIIQEYSEMDKRIIPLHNEKNWGGNWFFKVVKDHDDDSYLCVLDADDEYAPVFLQQMIAFVEENNLDVASCGTDFINEDTGEFIKHKILDKSIILEDHDFAAQFPIYRNFMVTVWGAVYSIGLLKKCNIKWMHKAYNFSDTAFCMETFSRAKRAGVLAESLHKYYVSPKMGSSKYNPNWFRASKYLHDISREYLIPYGKISKQNEDYLCVLYLILIKYILPRIQNSDVDLSLKLKNMRKIFTDRRTKYLLKYWREVGIYSDKEEFLREVKAWIASQNGYEKHQCTINKITAAMNSRRKGLNNDRLLKSNSR